MSVWISWFIIGVIYNLLYCRLFSKITDDNRWGINVWTVALSTLFSALNCYIVYKGYLIRPVAVNIGFIVILYCYFKEPFSKIIITVVQLYIIFALGELIFVNLFLRPGIISQSFAIENAVGLVVTNILIMIISLIVFKLPKVEKLIKNITKWYTEKRLLHVIILSVVAIFTMAIISYQNFGNDITKSYMLVTNTFLVCVIFFICGYLRQKAYNSRLLLQYDKLLEYVSTYENVLNEKIKTLHEYKNQLVLVRGMISNNNKKAINYINELLDIQETTGELQWLNKLSNIPQGALKGFIYYKVLQMKDKEIMVLANIDSDLNKNATWDVCDENLKDVSRVIGVYIDNAMEASLASTKKYVIIEIESREDGIVFTFSNTYAGTINLEKMDSVGFSTKGKGKGYGLSIVKDIITKNSHLEQQREINGIYYVQKLIIKK